MGMDDWLRTFLYKLLHSTSQSNISGSYLVKPHFRTRHGWCTYGSNMVLDIYKEYIPEQSHLVNISWAIFLDSDNKRQHSDLLRSSKPNDPPIFKYTFRTTIPAQPQ
jgi:hypothetical protein